MVVKTIVVGALQTNCYILENEKDALIIDPGDEPFKIETALDKKLIGIIITHHHDDHIGALNYFKNKYKVPIYDYYNLNEGFHQIGTFTFVIDYMPGHTNDSIVIYFQDEKIMFVGDFIFYHTIGRTDLEGGSWCDMKNSINKLKQYPDIKLYSGHGKETSLEEERINNIYFN